MIASVQNTLKFGNKADHQLAVGKPTLASMGNRQSNVTPTAHKKTTSGKSTAINKCLYSLGRCFAILVSPSLSNTFNTGQ